MICKIKTGSLPKRVGKQTRMCKRFQCVLNKVGKRITLPKILKFSGTEMISRF